MTDITVRLRKLYQQNGTDYVQEAADEIERLRAQVSDLTIKLENEKVGMKVIEALQSAVRHRERISLDDIDAANLLTEIERLRAELDALKSRLVALDNYIEYVGDALGQDHDRESLWDAAQRVLSDRDRLRVELDALKSQDPVCHLWFDPRTGVYSLDYWPESPRELVPVYRHPAPKPGEENVSDM